MPLILTSTTEYQAFFWFELVSSRVSSSQQQLNNSLPRAVGQNKSLTLWLFSCFSVQHTNISDTWIICKFIFAAFKAPLSKPTELPQISLGACDRWRVWPRPPGYAEGHWKVPVQTCDGAEPPAVSAGVPVAGQRGTTCFQQSELWRTELTLVRLQPGRRHAPRPDQWAPGLTESQHRVSLSLWPSANSATPTPPLSTESSQTLIHFMSSRRYSLTRESPEHQAQLFHHTETRVTCCFFWFFLRWGANDFSGFCF